MKFMYVLFTILFLSGSVLPAAEPQTPTFWKSRLVDVEQAVREVRKGQVRVLVQSPGKRNVYLVSYGAPVERRGTAGYGAACGGGDPASYARKDGKQPPVVWLLGPVHGGEVEGLVGLVNLLRVAETGKDHRGRAWPELAGNLAKCRVLVVPLANPDGRARFPWDSSVGRDLDERQRYEMGTDAAGKPYVWPQVKRIHPMRGPAVGRLGAYFNDDGVNLMHDEWFEPLAAETRAFLGLARQEAPDLVVSLHSHASHPSIEPTAYVPRTVKETIRRFGDRLQDRYRAAGLPHRAGGPEPKEDGAEFPPPSFNLTSALHHACGAAAMVHECCVGVADARYPKLTHEQILDLEMLLFDELFRFAVERRVDWTRK